MKIIETTRTELISQLGFTPPDGCAAVRVYAVDGEAVIEFRFKEGPDVEYHALQKEILELKRIYSIPDAR